MTYLDFEKLAPAAALIALWLWDRRRRFLEQHPQILIRRRARRAFHREIRNAGRAAQAGDTREFASAAVNAMRVACAPHFPAEPRALVGSDVLALLRHTPGSYSSLPQKTADVVRRFFDTTDASKFAGKSADFTELLSMRPDLDLIFHELEARL